MKKSAITLIIIAIFMAFSSCKKENSTPAPPPTANILGSWKFISQYTTRAAVNNFTDQNQVNHYKISAIYDLNTLNNAGTLVITANTMAISGYAYQLLDSTEQSEYQNDTLTVRSFTDIYGNNGPLSGTFNYQQVGLDSITFSNANFFYQMVALDAPETIGAKFKLNGDMLTITAGSSKDSSFPYGAITMYTNDTRRTELTFKKQ